MLQDVYRTPVYHNKGVMKNVLKLPLMVAASALLLASCNIGIFGPEEINGAFSLKLSSTVMTKCQTVVIENPYVTNADFSGKLIYIDVLPANGAALGAFTNATSASANLTTAGDYKLPYTIVSPASPQPFKVKFTCKDTGQSVTKSLSIDKSSADSRNQAIDPGL